MMDPSEFQRRIAEAQALKAAAAAQQQRTTSASPPPPSAPSPSSSSSSTLPGQQQQQQQHFLPTPQQQQQVQAREGRYMVGRVKAVPCSLQPLWFIALENSQNSHSSKCFGFVAVDFSSHNPIRNIHNSVECFDVPPHVEVEWMASSGRGFLL